MQRCGEMNESFLNDEEEQKRHCENDISDTGMDILRVEPLVGEPEYDRAQGNNECDGIAEDGGSNTAESFESCLRMVIYSDHDLFAAFFIGVVHHAHNLCAEVLSWERSGVSLRSVLQFL